jgi:polyhydroxybutyrate depolymerase
MHFHGTADDHAPYDGGNGRRSRTPTTFHSVAHTIERWVAANGCAPAPTVVDEPDRADDGMTVRRSSYSRCRNDAEVVLFTIDGGGHTWPGAPPGRRAAMLMLGPTTRDISANDLMWDFFSRHSLN